MINTLPIFDSHFHIIDKAFPLIPNNGFMPEAFICNDYLEKVEAYDVCGGAIVSGSFQSFDQSYLIDALKTLGPAFVGVTQLPATVSDDEIIQLNECGVRAVRFNLKRGGSEEIAHLSSMAKRVYDIANWHVELYVDASELAGLYDTLITLPAVCIDHLGLSKSGLKILLKLVEKNVRVKATGFGRVDFDVKTALKDLYSANPDSLMFGTDLPSTRAPKPYSDNDFLLVLDSFDSGAANKILSRNAIEFYKPKAF